MEKIFHRINTIEQLKSVPQEGGIEIDIRYHEDQLVLHHDAFHHHLEPKPQNFAEFLAHWKHEGIMILNVKTEGVEMECIRLMNQYKIKKWFFLDLSMPYFAIYAERAANREIEGFGIDNLAVRFSEREALEYALGFKNKAGWVWADCFSRMPLNSQNAAALKKAGFKICMVSPELQKHDFARITEFKTVLEAENIKLDAVCSKKPELWDSLCEAHCG